VQSSIIALEEVWKLLGWRNQQLYQFPILFHALSKNAQMNGMHAKKTPNAFPPFKTAKRNVEERIHVGRGALLNTPTLQQLMPSNVVKQMVAYNPNWKHPILIEKLR
jgi:hypothetical protein